MSLLVLFRAAGMVLIVLSSFFFFTATPTTEIYTLSLHDALPISLDHRRGAADQRRRAGAQRQRLAAVGADRKSTRLNSSHVSISYAVFCLKKKKKKSHTHA